MNDLDPPDEGMPAIHLTSVEKEEQKAIVKEALKEWLDAQWAVIGKWTVKGAAAAIFSAVAYWWLTTHGWHR